jgi:TctA family transporter
LVFAFTVLGAYMAYQDTMDIVLLAGFSALGCIMHRYNWPRPPLLLGFVLGRILERYVFLSFNTYGASWMLRPSVIILASLIVLSMLGLYRGDRRDAQKHTAEKEAG